MPLEPCADPRAATVASAELRGHLAETLGRVRFGGERLSVTVHGVAVAGLVPLEDLARLEALGDVPVPVVEVAVTVDASVDRVWRAVDDVRQRPLWMGSLTLDPWLDGEVGDRWFTPDGRLTVLAGRVTAADTTGGLELEWAERGCPGRTTARLQVRDEGSGSRITVVETGWARGDLARAEQHATRWREHLTALAEQCTGGLVRTPTPAGPAGPMSPPAVPGPAQPSVTGWALSPADPAATARGGRMS